MCLVYHIIGILLSLGFDMLYFSGKIASDYIQRDCERRKDAHVCYSGNGW